MINFEDRSWKLEAFQNISAIFLIIAALIAGLFIFSNHIEKERQAEKEKNRKEVNWARYLDPSIPAEKVRYYNPETGEVRYLEEGPSLPPDPELQKIFNSCPYNIPPEDYFEQVDELDLLEYYEFYRGD